MTQDNIILSGQALTKSYGRPPARVDVLHGVDLAVRRGEFVAIMGESGCGKSTLLHILGLMSQPDGGRLRIAGQDMTQASEAQRTQLRRLAVGFVFQRFNLLSMLSARENIRLSLRVRHLPIRRDRVDGILDRVGLASLANRKCDQMSIGQQQRVAVARALAHQPPLLLADEPTGNLDSTNSDSLLNLFRQVNAEGQTILMITHSAEAASRADRILRMRDGRLYDS